MRAPLICEELPESRYDEWQAFVESSPQGSVYSSPAYLRLFCRATGDSFRVLAASRAGELLGGIALVEQRLGSVRQVGVRPLLYYNGIVLAEHQSKYPSQQASRIIEATAALESAISDVGLHRVTFRNRSSLADARTFLVKGWSVRPSYTYVVPIHDLAAAWDRVEQNLRRLVKRCTNEGLVVTEDDDIDSVWRMHDATTVRKGTGAYLPELAFKTLLSKLRALGLCSIYHARLPDGRSVSAQVVLLGKHSVSHSVIAAADERYLNTGATPFLRWKVFESLSALGYAANDLTDAALNAVTHFKSQLGGNLETCMVFSRESSPPTAGRRLLNAISSRLRR